MTRTHVSRIAVTFGLVLGFAGCSELDDRNRDRDPDQTAGKAHCQWTEPDANGKKYLKCTLVTVIDTAQMNAKICDSTGMGVGC